VETQNTESAEAFEKEVDKLVDEPSLTDTRAIGEWLPDYVHQLEIKARVLDQLLGVKNEIDQDEHPVLGKILSKTNRDNVGDVVKARLAGDKESGSDSAVSGVVRRLSQLIVAQDIADQFRDAIETKVEEMSESIKRAKSLTDKAVKIEIASRTN
jgi:hypothetical protein